MLLRQVDGNRTKKNGKKQKVVSELLNSKGAISAVVGITGPG